MLVALLAPGSEQEATQLLAPILSVGDPEVSMTNGDWAANYAGFQIPIDREPANWKFNSHFVYDPFPAEAIALIGSFLAMAPTPECNYFTNAFGERSAAASLGATRHSPNATRCSTPNRARPGALR